MANSVVTPGLVPDRPLARPRTRAALGARVRALLVGLFLAALIVSEGFLGAAYPDLIINRAVGNRGFRLAAWEVDAWQQKINDAVNRPGARLSVLEQHDLVTTYFDNIGAIDVLTRQVERIYADPKESDPKAAAAALQARLDALRAEQARRRPAVEYVLQSQVAQVLHDTGLVTAGAVLPPVMFRFSESPDVLIVSPRDRIELQRSSFVQPGAPVDQMEQIEDKVEVGLGASALVEGTGGFSAYPTMVVEYADLEWVLSTIAHEWFHTYLAFQPLGWHYFDDGDTRTLNETTSSIVGDELGSLVLARFYPERVPPPVQVAPAPAGGTTAKPAQPAFSFSATMRATRLHVDELLKQGKIAEAEAYMESQRQLIVSHGYVLRKLNQAYFAFHGSYAVGGAATDPIGDKLRALRQRSHTLLNFVQTVAKITSVTELDRALQ